MKRKYSPKAGPLEAGARRVARRVEQLCRPRVPGCRAVATMDPAGGTFELRVGAAGAAPGECVRARGLEAATLAGDHAVARLARLLEVWIEPEDPVGTRWPAWRAGRAPEPRPGLAPPRGDVAGGPSGIAGAARS
ncbi:MAG: hypothetical protein OES32_05160 [Acidobacteriota bacterium]|nr:hypothetical protein [Acidobacteriota bacterium]MDH3522957.1 hypothetical protein [Acidobacteriota bacterium]